MIALGIFDGSLSYGYGAIGDARALSGQEIAASQAANAAYVQQAIQPAASYLMALGQWLPVPERPLDERFADFKIRLAAAIARHSFHGGGLK